MAVHYVSGNMAVAGVGVDHDTLTELVNKMPVREGPKPAVMQKATYHPGDSLSPQYFSLSVLHL